MSEEEADYNIDSADAGASDTIPCEAGQIKKGGEYPLMSFTCVLTIPQAT
jgi:hypothetical protein